MILRKVCLISTFYFIDTVASLLLRVNAVNSSDAPGPFPPTFGVGRSFYIEDFFLCCPISSQVSVVAAVILSVGVGKVVIVSVEIIIFIFNLSVVVCIRSAHRNNLLELGPQVVHKFTRRCPRHCSLQDLFVTGL